LSFVCSAD
jgi:cold-inducible RNA-binding protein